MRLPEPLASRLASYRAETGQPVRDALLALLTAALDARDARRRGAAARWTGRTPEERAQMTATARAAALARRRD
jgi:hypothetical protein